MAWTPDTLLVDMSPAECEEHLQSATLGRIGVVVDGHPAVFPICHVYLDGVLAFPTSAGTKLHGALDWPFVAYEVDGISADGLTGWSVMVAGRAEELHDEEQQARLAAARDVPWRRSPTLRWIQIVASEITGRRITAAGGAKGAPVNGG